MTDARGCCVARLGRACGRNELCHVCTSARVFSVMGLACRLLSVHVAVLPRGYTVRGKGTVGVLLVYVGLGVGAFLLRQLWCTFMFCVMYSVGVGPWPGHPCPQDLGFVLAGWGRGEVWRGAMGLFWTGWGGYPKGRGTTMFVYSLCTGDPAHAHVSACVHDRSRGAACST